MRSAYQPLAADFVSCSLIGHILSLQVGDLWKSYNRKIETDPIKAKAITSFLGFMIGDSIAQKVEGHTFSPIRCSPLT